MTGLRCERYGLARSAERLREPRQHDEVGVKRDSLDADLSVEALRMALARRHPGKGLLHHSDRGVQYAALDYRELLAAHQMISSMSRRANCYDNAVAESFFATLL